ncbi:helicase-related protein [Alphaproteobacteria bacterium]|nr:helicase-related protein [Alphaproteobacteria bacterium]
MKNPDFKENNLKAILGPTNTGKTFYAMERMLSHASGMIGFPLRLLARENYDKAVNVVGLNNVALITGEEKIIPKNAKYFCCTVEAMPIEKKVAFLCIDEIQLASDLERGYVFTDRLLNSRGDEETLFLGSETIKKIIQKILPECKIETRPRLSTLSYAGVKKITRLKERSAIVTFSIPEIYRIAELVRTQKGGAAVVMGALSPRTRNHQVEMYQRGDVNYLVATDAIGMGLNLDIDHIAFASDMKFDGNSSRKLFATEISQIAGRAGRSTKNGTFGVISDDLKFDKDLVQMVENHDFNPLSHIWWRNSNLDFSSIKNLFVSLEEQPNKNFLRKKGNALDFLSLVELSKLDHVYKNKNNKLLNELLWDICQIPDFGNIFSERHIKLLEQLYYILKDGKIEDDWLKSQISPLSRLDGEIDTLINRISNVRTWTYITNKTSWIKDSNLWQYETKKIENKLSDELHERLTKRFVDKKIAILSKKMNEKADLEAIIKFDGKVLVEGQEVGHLRNFDFIPEISSDEYSARILTAARKALPKELDKKVNEFVNSSEEALKLDDEGNILWMQSSIGRLSKGEAIYTPKIVLKHFDMLSLEQRTKIQKKCEKSISEIINKTLASCLRLKNLDKIEHDKDNKIIEISSKVKAINFHVFEGLGHTSIKNIPFQIQKINESDRLAIAKLGIRLGVNLIYLPIVLKPKIIKLKAMLWSIYNDKFFVDHLPEEGRVNCQINKKIKEDFYFFIGYMPCGDIGLRLDIYERLLALVRKEGKKEKFKITEEMLSIAGSTKDFLKDFITSKMKYKLLRTDNSENDQEYFFQKSDKINKFKNTKKPKIKNTKVNSIKLNKDSPFYILKSLKS